MGFIRTTRRLAFTVLLAAVGVEILAFKSLETVPLDVGYAPGTSQWIKSLGWPGIIIHYPASWFFTGTETMFAYFVVGYIDALVVIVAVIFLWRLARRLISTR
jgi:hypothetical protein